MVQPPHMSGNLPEPYLILHDKANKCTAPKVRFKMNGLILGEPVKDVLTKRDRMADND